MKKRIIIGIYKIVSPNNSVYVGQSKDILKRWSLYNNLICSHQPKLYNSLKKYGPKKHKFEVLQECTDLELNDLEKYYIDLYQCYNTKKGINLRDGGGSKGKHSHESIKKMSESKKGDKNPMYNKPISDSTREKRRISLGGSNHPGWGKKQPETQREKRRISLRNNKNAKRILVINTETGIFYDTIREANDTLSKHTYGKLKHKLRGTQKNNTAFIYA